MVVVVSPGSLGMATPIDELLGSSDYEFYQELDSYRDLGVDWFRLQINWNEVQATSGNYWWTKIDKVVKALVEYDIKIVGLFEGKASWASSTFSDSYTKNAWANFVYTATQRYSDVIDVWEIMNEPNVQNINPYNYTDALILSYNAIKSVDQDATVISAGTAAVPFSSGSFWGAAEYLQIMYQQGAKEYMDAVGFHPYTWPLQPTNPASYNGWQIMESDLRSIMTSYGDANKQIWMTELGAPTQGSGSAMTQAEQAQMIEEAYYLSQEYSWAGPILYYSYQDRGGSASDTENWFGLVDPYGNPKQAYYTFQHLASLNDSGEAKVYTFDSLSDLYISDFSSGDVLDFSGLDGNTDASGTQTFDFIGSNWLTAAGQVAVFVNTAAQLTYVQGYTDTQGGIDFSITLAGVHNLTSSNFIFPEESAGGGGNGNAAVHTFTYTGAGQRQVLSAYQSGDLIDLSGVDANQLQAGVQGFDFVGNTWLSGAGQLGVYTNTSQNLTYIQGDVNGGGNDFSIVLNGVYALGEDSFIFETSDSGTVHTVSGSTSSLTITDFQAGDVIDLSAIDSNWTSTGNQSFSFIGSNWLTGLSQLGVYHSSTNTYIQGSMDNDSAAELNIVLAGVHDISLEDLIL